MSLIRNNSIYMLGRLDLNTWLCMRGGIDTCSVRDGYPRIIISKIKMTWHYFDEKNNDGN